MLYRKNSWPILKPMHYYLLSDFSIDPQHFARTSATWKTHTQHISLKSPEKQRQKYVKYVAQFHTWFLFSHRHKNKLYAVRSGLCEALVLHAQSTGQKNVCRLWLERYILMLNEKHNFMHMYVQSPWTLSHSSGRAIFLNMFYPKSEDKIMFNTSTRFTTQNCLFTY